MWKTFVEKHPEYQNKECPLGKVVAAITDGQWCLWVVDTGDILACYDSKKQATAMLQELTAVTQGSVQHCECRSCGALFWSNQRCDQSHCPVCNEQDDIEELTGLL